MAFIGTVKTFDNQLRSYSNSFLLGLLLSDAISSCQYCGASVRSTRQLAAATS